MAVIYLSGQEETQHTILLPLPKRKAKIVIGLKGGPGSGYHGHGGRAGKEGGSAPAGTGTSIVNPVGPQGVMAPTSFAGAAAMLASKTPTLLPKDANGLATYKQWYQAQAAAGSTPNLSAAIAMRVALAQAAQAAAEAGPTSAAATPAAAPASTVAKPKAPAKKGKGGGKKAAAKPKAEAKPKAPAKGKAGGKKAVAKQPDWQKGLVQPPIMAGTTIPEAQFEERGEETFQTWLTTNVESVAKMTAQDKQEAYMYFVKRSQNMAKTAADPWAQVYIPDKPYSMLSQGIELPTDQTAVEAMFKPDAKQPTEPVAAKLWDYLKELGSKGQQAWLSWYQARTNAEHQKSIIPRGGKVSPPGTKEFHRIVIGLKGGPGSGNWGHAGRLGKLGGSVPKSSAMSIATGRDWQERQQVKIVMARQQFPSGGFATTEEAQTWASKAFPETKFDLSGAAPVVINPTLRAYATVAKQFPDVAKQVKLVEVKPGVLGGTNATREIIKTNGSTVTLNQDWYGAANAADLRSSTRSAVKAGFYPAGVDAGHYMASAMGVNTLKWLDTNPSANAKLTDWLHTNFKAAAQVSISATLGKKSFFGELFSAAYTTKSKSPLVAEFKALVDGLSAAKRAGSIFIGVKGGKGSGNFKHRGMPGRVGGSIPVSRQAELTTPQTGAEAVQMVGDIHDKYLLAREDLAAQRDVLSESLSPMWFHYQDALQADDVPGSKAIKAQIDAAYHKDTELKDQIDALYSQETQEIAEKVLKVDDPILIDARIVVNKDKPAAADVETGVVAFQNLVSEKTIPGYVLPNRPAVDIHLLTNKGGRSYYSDGKNAITPFTHSRSSASIQITTVHELGHWLEDRNPTIHKRAVAFRDQRTKGETAVHIKGRDYTKNEVFKPDNFPDEYSGKIYTNNHATEIISMGLQHMADEPWRFAMKDPEYFAFMWETLRGAQ